MGSLMKVIAPGAGSLAEASSVLEAQLEAPLSAITDRLDDDRVWAVFEAMAEVCEVKAADAGQWVSLAGAFEVHFLGRDLEMLQWLWWALGVQYRPLFGAVRAKLAGMGDAEPAAPSKSPSISPGLSGGSSSEGLRH